MDKRENFGIVSACITGCHILPRISDSVGSCTFINDTKYKRKDLAFQDRHVVNFFEIFECVVLWMVDENIVRTNYERMNGVISFFFLLFDVQSNAASQSIS